MVPRDDWGHIGARSRLDPLLSVFVDCVCEVTIFRHRRPPSGQRRSESKSQWPRGRCGPAGLDRSVRWSSRLVTTASENRLKHFRANPPTVVAAAKIGSGAYPHTPGMGAGADGRSRLRLLNGTQNPAMGPGSGATGSRPEGLPRA
jgi:hypothetical protein